MRHRPQSKWHGLNADFVIQSLMGWKLICLMSLMFSKEHWHWRSRKALKEIVSSTRTIIPTALQSLSHPFTIFHQHFMKCHEPVCSLLKPCYLYQHPCGASQKAQFLSTRMDIHTAMALSLSVPSKGPLGSKMKFKAKSKQFSKQVPQKQFSLGPIVSTCLYCLRWELETRARTCESFKESDRLSLHCGLQRHSPYSPCKSISPYQLSLAVHLWLPLYKHSLGHPQTPVQSLNAKPINVLKYIEMNWPAPRISASEVSKQFANRPFAQSLGRSQFSVSNKVVVRSTLFFAQ